jgi:hypothetical protein
MNSITSIEDFETLSSITLANPHGMQGGAYFSKLQISGKPLFIQTPKCSTKNGIHITDKKTYCDLMFTEDNNDFLSWIEELQSTIKNLIYDKKDLWFHNEMDLDSIDYHWQNALRVYKQKKTLVRCFLPKKRGLHSKYSIQIFDENENQLSMDDITKDTNIISILEISGLKFTSQSFQLEFNIRQMMTVKEEEIFNKCLIKLNKPNNTTLEEASDKTLVEDSSSSGEDCVNGETEDILNKTDNSTQKIHENPMKKLSVEKIIDSDNTNETESQIGQEHDNRKHIVRKTNPKSLEESSLNLLDLESLSETTKHENLTKNDLTINDKNAIQNENNNAIQNENNNAIQNENTTINVDTALDNVKETILKEVTDDIIFSLKNQEGLEKKPDTVTESLEKTDEISEVNIEYPHIESVPLTLKKPNEVYMEIYKEARKKAKESKKAAVQAYLEAKRIKSLYLLDEIESSDDEFDINEYTD